MKITLCVDKQSRDNPSSELRQYLIDIGCPLRSYGEFFDELKISTDDTNNLVGVIIRRCYVDKYGVLKKLDTEETQELEIPKIMLFEGTNYVYIQEFTNLNMKIEYLTNADMNKYFATKAEMNSSIKQTYDSIIASVSTKADKTELQSAISILSKQIELSVSSKVDEEELESAITILNNAIALRVIKDQIIASINVSPETVTILANKLGLTANDVLDIIAGNEINLKTKNLSFVSDNFSVDKNGNMVCNDAVMNNATMNNINIVDGKILINDTSDSSNSLFTIQNGNIKGNYGSGFIFLNNEDNNCAINFNTANGDNGHFSIWQYDYLDADHNAKGYRGIDIDLSSTSPSLVFSAENSNKVRFTKENATFNIPVYADSYNNNSLEEQKKNFQLFNKGLELIMSSDFYLYNYKTEKDDKQKHIGLVIGNNYKTPTEFINEKGDAIDLYSLISACGDAIKTLNGKVIELEKQIKEMK